jgi:CubicO group peptidase (beta-lactamase class C family)
LRLLLIAALLPVLGCSTSSPHASTQIDDPQTFASAPPTASTDELDSFIHSTMAEADIPGLAVAVVKGNRMEFAKGYGLSNVEQQTPVTPDTDFLISSCSKTLGAVTLMQLYDQGKFRLDDDINRYLPFNARNPNFPNKPITIRQLLTHTSSIARDWLDENGNDSTAPGDPAVELGDFLRSYFTPGSRYYSKDNFLDGAPGSEYEYSNIGAALWGYLAERIAGVPFYRLSEQTLFSPLGMTNTSWRLAGLDQSKLATQYDQRNGRLVAVKPFSYEEYPSGSIRTSVSQLAKFLLMFMDDGSYQGVKILKPATVAEMRRRQIPDIESTQGLVWYYDSLNGKEILGHDGTDTGSGCYMFYRISDKAGVILLTNVRNNDKADEAIAAQLFTYAASH